MAEYIEREAVMQKFADHVRRSNNSDFAPVPTWNQAVQIVEDFPAADAIEELRDALLLMVLQYCTTDDGLLYHSFMSAGENAFAVLGLENGQQADPLWDRVLIQKPPKEGE